MKNVILYCRVSTDDQAKTGTSLDSQEEQLRRYCESHSLNIVAVFREDFSAKTFIRPEWKKIELLVKTDKSIDGLLVSYLDRLSRNHLETLQMIEKFKRKNIEINSLDHWTHQDRPEDKITLYLLSGLAELNNSRHSERVTIGLRQAKKEGRYVGQAPLGYKNSHTPQGRAYIEPDSNADVVKYIFSEFARGIYHPDQLRRKLRLEQKLNRSRNAFSALLTNIVYVGKVRIPATKNTPEIIIQGIHLPIIDDDTFQKVQFILSGRKRGSYSTKKEEIFPLKGHLLCPTCMRNLTASLSKGNGGHYSYYHCQSPCKCRFRTRNAEEDFLGFLKSIVPKDEVLKAYKMILQNVSSRRQKDASLSTPDTKRKLTEVEADLTSLDNKLIKNIISSDRYKIMHDQLKKSQNHLKYQLSEMQISKTSSSDMIDKGFHLLARLDYFYEKGTSEQKKKIIGSIFPEKLVYENCAYRTNKNNELMALMRGNLIGVGNTGFEPVTFRV